jgi:hypothetical protein
MVYEVYGKRNVRRQEKMKRVMNVAGTGQCIILEVKKKKK